MIGATLRQRLAWRQCVAYVGAGFSMACGMPGWGDLLSGLLHRCRMSNGSAESPDLSDAVAACENAIQSGQFTMAASMLRRMLMPADLDEAIRQRFGNHVLTQAPRASREIMEARMRHLVRGPWAGIVTTNFDTLVEKAIGHWVDREVVMVNEDNPRLGSVLATAPQSGFFFVKTHGSISGGSIVLSTDEYDRTYLGTPRMTSFLSALCLRYFVVFIGCSLEDEIVRIRRKLSADFGGLIPPAYALLPATEPNRMREGWLRDSAKVECILYRDDEGRHAAVDKFLAQAARSADLATSDSPRGEVTRSDILKLPVRQRLERIGFINRELLRLVAGRPGSAIDHLDLVDLTRLDDAASAPPLFELSPEERVYRALFLVSIGLLLEETNGRGAVRYAASPAALRAGRISEPNGSV